MAASANTVHIVDDDEAVRDSLAVLFQTADLQVRAYPSPTVFLEDMPDLQHGCVITDVQMPDMDGLEFLRRLKGCQPDARVIVITARADRALAEEATAWGADFVEKPFDGETILSAVRSAMARG